MLITDTDGFVIPSLTVGSLNYADSDAKVVDKGDTRSPPPFEVTIFFSSLNFEEQTQ